MNKIKWILLFVVLLLSPFYGEAIEYRYSIDSNYRHSDNITESENNISGTSFNTNLSFNLSASSNIDWQVALSGSFGYQEFSEESISNRENKSFTGRVEYQPRNNNLSLIVIDQLSQVPADRFATQSDINLRETNTFSVIPAYFFSFSSLDRVNMQWTFIDSDNANIAGGEQLRDASQVSKNFTLDYRRRLNSRQQLFAVFNTSEIKFDSLDGTDYKQQDTSLRWVIQGRATGIQIEAGISDIKDENNNKIDANLTVVNISRQINRTHSLEFNSRTGFDSDIETNSVTNVVNVDGENNNFFRAQKINELFTGYNITSDGFNSRLQFFDRRSEDAIGDNEEQQDGYELVMSYPISRMLFGNNRAELEVTYSDTNGIFTTDLTGLQTQQNNTKFFEIAYSHSYNGNLSLNVRVSKRDVSGDLLVNRTNRGNSNSVSVGFTYSPSGAF